MTRLKPPSARRHHRQRGTGALGIALRIAVAVLVVLVVAGGVFGYTALRRSQNNPNQQAAWAARTAMAVAGGADGTLYIAFLREIYRVSPGSKTATLIAGRARDPGSAQPAAAGDGQPALGAAIRPSDLAIGPQGQVYFADQLTQSVRTIVGGDLKSLGKAQTIGGIGVNPATDVVYFSDQAKDQVFAVSPTSGAVSAIAGTGQAGYLGDDKAATTARLNDPIGLTCDRSDLFIADSRNNRIRQVELASGVISTIGGSGNRGDAGDGGPAWQARLADPLDIAIAANGYIAVADAGNHKIRQVVPGGNASTLAGSGQPGTDDPGSSVAAMSAHLTDPTNLAYVGSTLYFIDDFQLRTLQGGQVSFYTPPGMPS